MMLPPSSRPEPLATSIRSKCRQHPQASTRYNDKSERNIGAAYSPRLQQHSYQVQNQPMQSSEEPRPAQCSRIEHANPSQLSICDNFDQGSCLSFNHECSDGSIRDEEAARQVEKWFKKRRKPQLTSRIFRNLVIRHDELDDNSLDDLLLAADKTIFCRRLSGRVQWKWSEGQPEYEHDLLGTTALRPADPSIGGFETLIVLSKPLLQNKRFSRDLLLSAFLHELIHSYLFIQCGLKHAKDAGHTEGFRKIAKLIDENFGQQRLHLCNMRANLDHFLVSEIPVVSQGGRFNNGQVPAQNLFLKPELGYYNSRDEGYYSRDRSPNAEFSYSHAIVDEGYSSRSPSPGSPGSPGSPQFYVVGETGSKMGGREAPRYQWATSHRDTLASTYLPPAESHFSSLSYQQHLFPSSSQHFSEVAGVIHMAV